MVRDSTETRASTETANFCLTPGPVDDNKKRPRKRSRRGAHDQKEANKTEGTGK